MRCFQGNRLKNLRINHGYSLEMTARLLGLRCGRTVTRSAISHWERGYAQPTTENLLALGESFQVPVDYFFDPLPNYLFGMVELPRTRRGKPPLPEMTMMLEPALQAAGLAVGAMGRTATEPSPPNRGPEQRGAEAGPAPAELLRS